MGEPRAFYEPERRCRPEHVPDVEASNWLNLGIGFGPREVETIPTLHSAREHVGLTRLTLDTSSGSNDAPSSEETSGKDHRPWRAEKASVSVAAPKKRKDGFSQNQEKKKRRKVEGGEIQSKRRRNATARNLAEKRRRRKFNQKIKTLQSLLPNSSKTDKASILEEVVDHVKLLKAHIEAIPMACRPPFQMFAPQQFQVPRFRPVMEINTNWMGNCSALHYNCHFMPFSGNYSAIPMPSGFVACQPQVLGNHNGFNRVAISNLPSRPILRSLSEAKLPHGARLRERSPNI